MIYKKITGKNLNSIEYESFLKSLSAEARNGIVNNEHIDKLLKYLLEDLDKVDHLGVFGRSLLRKMITNEFEKRARIITAIEKDPDILNTNFDNPVVIMTLPRTGSTFLHLVLSQDSTWKSPELWEMATVVPFIRDPLTKENKKTLKEQVKEFDFLKTLSDQGFGAAHNVTATDPEDILFLSGSEGVFLGIFFLFELPNYSNYLRNLSEETWIKIFQNIKNAYKVIGRYQNMEKRRFLLMNHITIGCNQIAFAKVFPDAQYITIHRDVSKVAQSITSLSLYFNKLYINPWADIKEYLARTYTERLTFEVKRMPSWRNNKLFQHDAKKNEKKKIIDINFEDLINNLIPTLKYIYEEVGLEFTEKSKKAIEKYIGEQKKHKYGSHKYPKLPIDKNYIRRVTKDYTRTYNVKIYD